MKVNHLTQPISRRTAAPGIWVALFFAGFFACGSISAFAFEIHFEKTGYQVGSGLEYAIRYELKNLIAQHEAAFHRKVPADFQITYRIFPTYEAYEAYSATVGKKVERRLLGFTRSSFLGDPATGEIMGVNAEIVMWRQEQPAILISTALHETTHAVTQAFLRHVPLWMNEGSADWFGRPAWAESDAQQLDRARRWRYLKRLLEQKKLPPLRPFLESESYEEWRKMFNGDIGVGYLVGYSIFDFFMSDAKAKKFLVVLLSARDVEQGEKPGAAFTAHLNKFWPGGLAQFERDWQAWILYRAEFEVVPPPPVPEKIPGKKR